MVDSYFILKTIHVISSTILFGTGLGTAFFMWWGNVKGNLQAKFFVARTTVLADFIFTTPAVFIQPITGILLIENVGYEYSEPWLLISYALFILTGICWLPVVWIQIRLKNILIEMEKKKKTKLTDEYSKLFKTWFLLGWPAFISVIGIFWLMVYKPTFD
jgi:uncharacterized membrane protein